jgi:hypothetical protein
VRSLNLRRLRRLTTWPTWAWIVAHLLGLGVLCAAIAQLYCTLHGGDFIPRFWQFMAWAVPMALLQYVWHWHQRRRARKATR